jgi:hypothetical protein
LKLFLQQPTQLTQDWHQYKNTQSLDASFNKLERSLIYFTNAVAYSGLAPTQK